MDRVGAVWCLRFNIVELDDLRLLRVACGPGSESASSDGGREDVLERAGRDVGVNGIESLMTIMGPRGICRCVHWDGRGILHFA